MPTSPDVARPSPNHFATMAGGEHGGALGRDPDGLALEEAAASREEGEELPSVAEVEDEVDGVGVLEGVVE